MLELTIENIGSHGEGLARKDGVTYFVPKTAPQDKVRVIPAAIAHARAEARLLELLEPSSLRRKPLCQHFEECGGCDFQHLSYEQQRDWKLKTAKHWISRSPIAGYAENLSLDWIGSPQEFGYRHRAKILFQNGKPAFRRPRSHDLLPLEECPIFVPGFFEALNERAQNSSNTDHAQDFSFDGTRLIDEKGSYENFGRQMFYDSSCFTQANLEANRLLIQKLREEFESLSPRKTLLDLYCGIGNLSIPLGDLFSEIVGVEDHPRALQFAKQNAPQMEWIQMHSEDAVQKFRAQNRKFDAILLDPARVGAFPIMKFLPELEAKRIIYVSCSLASLIRDLTAILRTKKYNLGSWTLVDLFPQTKHIESIVSLTLQ